jgi:hypothetical protein
MRRALLLMIMGVCGTLPLGARAANPAWLSAYFGNSVVCKALMGPASCHLWLNADGSYDIFYDRGMQSESPKDMHGPFEFEGRDGSYRLENAPTGYRLCLTPNKAAWGYAIEKTHELFAEASCYAIAPHQIGDAWLDIDAYGKHYKMWLLAGR